jgi:Cu-Zn family superoxide dismutase
MRRTAAAWLASTCASALVAGCGGGDAAPAGVASQQAAAGATPSATATGGLTATLRDPKGADVGTVHFSQAEGGTQVSVQVNGLPRGFHGFHVHAVGVCEPNSANPTDPSMTGNFLSAGAHIGGGQTDHGEHEGDLPLLYVTASGTGSLTTVTDALTLSSLTDADGSAVIVHADPDNYAHIPTRYAPGGPDAVTRNTGDAGVRIACGLVKG